MHIAPLTWREASRRGFLRSGISRGARCDARTCPVTIAPLRIGVALWCAVALRVSRLRPPWVVLFRVAPHRGAWWRSNSPKWLVHVANSIRTGLNRDVLNSACRQYVLDYYRDMRTIYAASIGILAALLITGCSSGPTLEDAGKACVRYLMYEKDASAKNADEACELYYTQIGEEAFIEEWTK